MWKIQEGGREQPGGRGKGGEKVGERGDKVRVRGLEQRCGAGGGGQYLKSRKGERRSEGHGSEEGAPWSCTLEALSFLRAPSK